MPGQLRDRLPEPVRVNLGRMRWQARWLMRRITDRAERLAFTCNVCGRGTSSPMSQLGRELPSCGWCASTIRARALVEAISHGVFDGDHLGPHLPHRAELSGLGLSDPALYARHLARSTTYVNSWFHKPPFLDITREETLGEPRFDYVVCSEVLEHVDRPVEAAITNLFRLLKPGGLLVMSVPHARGTDRGALPRTGGIRRHASRR